MKQSLVIVSSPFIEATDSKCNHHHVYSQNQSHHRTHCYCAPPAADAQILHSAKRRFPRTCPSTRGLASPFCASCLSCAPWQRCGCEHGLLQRVQQHLYHASCRRHLHQHCNCSIALCEHVHTWLRLLPSWSAGRSAAVYGLRCCVQQSSSLSFTTSRHPTTCRKRVCLHLHKQLQGGSWAPRSTRRLVSLICLSLCSLL